MDDSEFLARLAPSWVAGSGKAVVHDVKIVNDVPKDPHFQRYPGNKPSYRAVCSCGWYSKWFWHDPVNADLEAQVARANHLKEVKNG